MRLRSLVPLALVCFALSAGAYLLIPRFAHEAERLDTPTGTRDETVSTDTGDFRGVREGGSFAWKGVPYSANTEVRPDIVDAVEFGPRCPQPSGFSKTVNGCLTLNIWRPDNLQEPAPVIFFIHGGSYVRGESDAYSGEALATEGRVIFVSANYRLGAYGFLVDEKGGNGALLDIIEALEWVQRNISSFGGDPSRVTLMGFSAGGGMVHALLVSPFAAGLFARAAFHSGVLSPGEILANHDDLFKASNRVRRSLGCTSSSGSRNCLESRPVNEVIEAALGVPWQPTVDGVVVPTEPYDAFREGKGPLLPVIVASASREFSWRRNIGNVAFPFLAVHAKFQPGPGMYPDYEASARAWLGESRGGAFLRRYPRDQYPSAFDALAAGYGDEAIHCPSEEFVDSARDSGSPVFRVVLDHDFGDARARDRGEFHGADLWLLFRKSTYVNEFELSPKDLELSRSMIGYWSRFAHTGDPNGGDAVVWEPSGYPRRHLVLSTNIRMADSDTDICEFWKN